MSRISEMLSQPPLAAGTVSGCAQYFAHSLPAVVEQPHPHEATSWQSQFSCEAVAARVGVDVESLMKWNPSLASDACVLQPDLNYCIVKIDRSEKPSTMTQTKTSAEPPICSFNPEKGEYDCPDPRKGEYAIPESTSTGESKMEKDKENSELK